MESVFVLVCGRDRDGARTPNDVGVVVRQRRLVFCMCIKTKYDSLSLPCRDKTQTSLDTVENSRIILVDCQRRVVSMGLVSLKTILEVDDKIKKLKKL